MNSKAVSLYPNCLTAITPSISDMLFNDKFQKLLLHSTPKEIDQKVQAFLA